MNTVQKNYMKAKAIVDNLEAQEKQIEQAYMLNHGIVNPDGTTPEHIWCIEDEAIFDKANEETAPIIEKLGIYQAKKILRETEDDLIRFGLSLAPAKERQVLTDRCFGLNGKTILLNIRENVIELAFKLDTRTIPKFAR